MQKETGVHKLLVMAVVLACTVKHASAVEFTKGPYLLQSKNTTSMTIMWETKGAGHGGSGEVRTQCTI